MEVKERTGRCQTREIKWRPGGAMDFQIRSSKSDLHFISYSLRDMG
jgi:hypothetical protein